MNTTVDFGRILKRGYATDLEIIILILLAIIICVIPIYITRKLGLTNKKKKINKSVIKKNKKNTSKKRKLILGSVGLVFLFWIFGVFDGGGGKGIHHAVTEYKLDGNTVYATAYVNYGVSAKYCAQNVMHAAYGLMKTKYKSASKLVLTYGVNATDKYGKDIKKEIGTFTPDVSTLRRYESSNYYVNGELVTALGIVRKFNMKGFR